MTESSVLAKRLQFVQNERGRWLRLPGEAAVCTTSSTHTLPGSGHPHLRASCGPFLGLCLLNHDSLLSMVGRSGHMTSCLMTNLLSNQVSSPSCGPKLRFTFMRKPSTCFVTTEVGNNICCMK